MLNGAKRESDEFFNEFLVGDEKLIVRTSLKYECERAKDADECVETERKSRKRE